MLVIVHGGEYGWNAGNAFNATILAAHGQVLIVTLNYRLGVYGNYFIFNLDKKKIKF